MLDYLTIHHIALIEDVTIRFHHGMHVLTGETGAGKSIVVDSVNLILGGRADRELIRSGYERASVEAVFDTPDNQNVKAFLDQEGIEYDGRTVTVYREITANGKNICRVCGVILPLSKLRELAPIMLDLHGQSEHQFLADPEMHLAFLDQTGDEKHSKLLARIKNEYQLFIDNHRAYARLVKRNENRDSRMRSLEHDLEELRRANVQRGEAALLSEKRKQQEKTVKEAEALNTIRDSISGNEESRSCLSGLRLASDTLKKLAASDESVREISDRCESLYYELEEIAYKISIMSENADTDPESLLKTDNRLDLIHRLERKYQTDSDELPNLLKEMEEEYRQLADLGKELETMASEHKRLLLAYRGTARELTDSRKNLANQFEKRITKELEDLGMGNTLFRVEFKINDTGKPLMPKDTGDDRIEFMISPNPGEPLKPLAKIASGGELSRLMLAIKTLESGHTGVESMVFDEIDTGISGRMAQVVAEKMMSIARERQVICVTHLPQIAATADYHYQVRKTVTEGRTSTSVIELDMNGRTGEVSRMISGADGISDESNAYAARMLKAAHDMKSKV